MTNNFIDITLINPQNVKNIVKLAYLNKDSLAYKIVKKNHDTYFGICGPELLEVSKQNRSIIYQAEVALFNEGFRPNISPVDIGFKDIKVNCNSAAVGDVDTYLFGFYDEIRLLKYYDQLLGPNDIYVDVGANAGIHSIAASKVLQPINGSVISIEPRENLVEIFKKNINLNHPISNIEIHNCLLYSEETELGFNSNETNFNQGVGQIDLSSSEKIKATTLDKLLETKTQRIKLIKIDVEGAEIEVLKGGRKIIESNQPSIIVEHNSPEWSLRDLFACFPYEIVVKKIPFFFYENEELIHLNSRINGFSNLLISKK